MSSESKEPETGATFDTPKAHDVIYGSEDSPANKLLADLVCLHRKLLGDAVPGAGGVDGVDGGRVGVGVGLGGVGGGDGKDGENDDSASTVPAAALHLVRLFQNGMGMSLPTTDVPNPSILLRKKGSFFKKEGTLWSRMTEAEACQFVKTIWDSQGGVNLVNGSNTSGGTSTSDRNEAGSSTVSTAPTASTASTVSAASTASTAPTTSTVPSTSTVPATSTVSTVPTVIRQDPSDNSTSAPASASASASALEDVEMKDADQEGANPKTDERTASSFVSSSTSIAEPVAAATADLKLFPLSGNVEGSMNQFFLINFVQEALRANRTVTVTSPSRARVQIAFEILDRAKACVPKARILVKVNSNSPSSGGTNGDTELFDTKCWRELSETEAAEFLVTFLFEKLREIFASHLPDIPIAPTGEVSLPEDYSRPGTHPIDCPSRYDVLFGRGGMTNNHAGNRRFRDIISLHRPDYVRAIKIEKPNVARRIVAAIRTGNPPGRFLKKNPSDLKWYDVGNRHATEKTSQALREKSATEKHGRDSTEGDVRKRLLEQAMYEARMTRMRLAKEGTHIPSAYPPLDAAAAAAGGNATAATTILGASNGGSPPSAANGAAVASTPPQYVPITPAMVQGAVTPYVTLSSGTPASGSGDDKAKAGSAVTLIVGKKATDEPYHDPAFTSGDWEKLRQRKQELASIAAKNDKEDPPSTDRGEKDSEGNIIVTENDILCGRGGLTNHHRGNKRFRDIVALHRSDYIRAPKVNKPAVARLIVRAIRNSDPPGRFLKKDEKTGKWFDIGDKRAAEKASQALREKTSDERGTLKVDGSITAVPLRSFQNPAYTAIEGTTAILMVPPVGAGLPTIQQVPNDMLPKEVKQDGIKSETMRTNGVTVHEPTSNGIQHEAPKPNLVEHQSPPPDNNKTEPLAATTPADGPPPPAVVKLEPPDAMTPADGSTSTAEKATKDVDQTRVTEEEDNKEEDPKVNDTSSNMEDRGVVESV